MAHHHQREAEPPAVRAPAAARARQAVQALLPGRVRRAARAPARLVRNQPMTPVRRAPKQRVVVLDRVLDQEVDRVLDQGVDLRVVVAVVQISREDLGT